MAFATTSWTPEAQRVPPRPPCPGRARGHHGPPARGETRLGDRRTHGRGQAGRLEGAVPQHAQGRTPGLLLQGIDGPATLRGAAGAAPQAQAARLAVPALPGQGEAPRRAVASRADRGWGGGRRRAGFAAGGSAAPTRTPTACRASASRRAGPSTASTTRRPERCAIGSTLWVPRW